MYRHYSLCLYSSICFSDGETHRPWNNWNDRAYGWVIVDRLIDDWWMALLLHFWSKNFGVAAGGLLGSALRRVDSRENILTNPHISPLSFSEVCYPLCRLYGLHARNCEPWEIYIYIYICALHFHCSLDDLGASKRRRVATLQSPKKTDKQLLMLKTNLFSIVLGSLPNWAAFAPTYLDDTYIIFQFDIQCTMIHIGHHPKRSFEREFFEVGGILGELQAGVCSVRFYSDGSVGRFASPLQFRKNRIGFGCFFRSQFAQLYSQMTQKWLHTDCW